jgi:phage tail sheath protein FI
MAADFLHGTETIEVDNNGVSIRVVKSATIFLVGIAPIGPINTLTLVTNPTEAAQFGKPLPGFNIPMALELIFAQGGATVVVVNVFDLNSHREAGTTTRPITNRRMKLAHAPIGLSAGSPGNRIVLSKTGFPSIIYQEGVDYTLDEWGNIVAISNQILDGQSCTASYSKLNISLVSDANVIGVVNIDGTKTGMQLHANCFNTFGFKCKIFISPVFCERGAIAAEMLVVGNKYKQNVLIDAPITITKAQAITGRGPLGVFSSFNVSSKRAILLYDHFYKSDPDPEALSGFNVVVSYSPIFAGIMCNTDNNEGYWVSPSNQPINGVLRTTQPLSWAINDPDSDVNQLNANGIVSVANGFGVGLTAWGNRNASFPAVSTIETFIKMVRVADIVDESVELAMLPFIDKDINQGNLDAIRQSVNDFINTQIGRGALLPGSECTYDPADNSSSELAAGHAVFRNNYVSGPPLERLTFNRSIDSRLLVFS